MSEYEQNTLDQLGDMNYKIKLEEIGIRSRPIRQKDLTVNNKFTKEMLESYGKLYNQPIESIDPETGEKVFRKYQKPVDDVELEIFDEDAFKEFIDYDENLIDNNNAEIEKIAEEIQKFSKLFYSDEAQQEIKLEYLAKKDELDLLLDKIDSLETEIFLINNEYKSLLKSFNPQDKSNRRNITNLNKEFEQKRDEYDYLIEQSEVLKEEVERDKIGKIIRIDGTYYTGGELISKMYDEINALKNKNIAEYGKLEAINEDRKMIKKINKERIEKHKEILNTLNSGAFKMEQAQGESEEDYLQRLEETANQPYTENLYFNANIESIEKLKNNLKNVSRNESINEGVVNGLSPEERFLVNKYWGDISRKLLNVYGFNNKSVLSTDYLETIDKILNEKETGVKAELPKSILETYEKPSVRKEVSSVMNKMIRTLERDERVDEGADFVEDTRIEVLENISGNKMESKRDIDIIQMDNILRVYSNITNKDIYIKLGEILSSSKRRKVILVSFEPVEGTFNLLLDPQTNVISKKERDKLKMIDFSVLENVLGISTEQILREIFGISGSSDIINRAWDYLADRYTLESKNKNVSVKNEAMKNNLTGWGVKADDVPKIADFGNAKILLNKLYYKSILSVKDHKGHNIHGFPIVKVSEPFVDIVMKLNGGEKIKKHDINILPDNEHELYNRLMQLTGLKHHHETSIESSISDIKKRIELIEGQISAGNNNKDLLKELNDLLYKLVNFGVITRTEAKKHLLIIEHDFFN